MIKKLLTLLFLSTVSHAAISVVAGAHASCAGSGSTGCTTGSVTTTTCDLIVIAASTYSGKSAFVISDNKSNFWKANTTFTRPGVNQATIYYSTSPVVGSGHTFTMAGSSNFGSIAVVGFTGTLASTSFDVQNGANAGTATIQPGSVSPSADNELIVTALSFAAAGTASINSSFIISDQVNFVSTNYGAALGYIINGAGTSGVAVNPTWTSGGGSTDLAAAISTFKAATVVSGVTINAPTLGAEF